jgi:formylglycine-generating enzyme required for sulfatase activity
MSNKITDEDIEKAIVKLKPVFGIKPGIYLTVIYGFIVLLGLFLLMIYPGIKNNGTMVHVDTSPGGAVVYVDNIYKGTTPTYFFVEKGNREIRIEKKYFETIKFQELIGSKIFGSLLFPGKFKINDNLTLINQEGFLEDRFKQLSSFALIEDYYDRYQMPSLISKTVSEYLSGLKTDNKELLYDFLYSMRVNLGSPEMVYDYVKAISLTNNIIISNPVSNEEDSTQPDLSVIFDYFADENNIQGLLLSIIKAYPLDKRENVIERLEKIEGVKSILNDLYTDYFDIEISDIPAVNGKTVVINNNKFIGFSSGTYLTGPSLPEDTQVLMNDDILISFPHIETVSEFYILEKEVTRRDYSLFLDENPEWKVENINNLIENNLVTNDYLNLQDFNDKGKPVSNISWYAAAAYSDWLETKLPPNMSEYNIKLPSEAQWEAAARFSTVGTLNNVFHESGVSAAKSTDFSRIGGAGLYDIMGNLWEWSENWFFPTDSVNSSFGLSGTSWDGMEKAVRGGSWANSEADIEVSTRGSQNPAWCTPFLGFRPVLVKN